MPKLIWSEKYSVKITEIDNQHKKLIEMVNELSDAMAVGKGKDVLGGILGKLVNYTRTHFAAEERLMQTHGYPKLDEHRKEHQDLTRQVLDIQTRFQAGSLGLTIPTATFLNDWLSKHILETDFQYVGYLTSKGVK